jgi:hypothetical protein
MCCHFLLCSTVVFLVEPLRGDEKLSKKHCDTNNILIALQLILNRKIAMDLSLDAKEEKERKNYKGTISNTYVNSGFVFYFKACTIPTKLCLGLSLKLNPISGVVSLLNRIILSTIHMTIFLPHTRS